LNLPFPRRFLENGFLPTTSTPPQPFFAIRSPSESWPVFDAFCEKAEDALRQGSFNARQDRHVTFCTFLLDDRGRRQVNLGLRRCKEELRGVQRNARERAGRRSSPPQVATFLFASFEDPDADCNC